MTQIHKVKKKSISTLFLIALSFYDFWKLPFITHVVIWSGIILILIFNAIFVQKSETFWYYFNNKLFVLEIRSVDNSWMNK